MNMRGGANGNNNGYVSYENNNNRTDKQKKG